MPSRRLLAVLLPLLLTAGIAAVAYAQDQFAEMDALYAKRSGTDTVPKQVLELAEKAYASAPSFDAAWRASRACFWICDRTGNKQTKKDYGKRGWDWGQKAIDLQPNRPEGYFYGCACMGEYSKGLGILTALKEGIKSKFEKMGNRSVAIDPAFDYASPLRLMGQYYQNLPLIAGQDYAKAADFYQRAVQTAPCMTRSHFYLADLYRLDKKWEKARAAVEAGLAAPACPNGAHAWENNFYRGELQKLQGSLPAK